MIHHLPLSGSFKTFDESRPAGSSCRVRDRHDLKLAKPRSRPTRAADSTWTSDTDTVFDGTYRHLLRAAKAKEREG